MANRKEGLNIWLEVKAVFSLIAISMMMVVLVLSLFGGLVIFVFLIFLAIFMLALGDIIVGLKITNNHLKVLMDPLPSSHELCVLFDFSGNMDFLAVKKGQEGTRSFVKYNRIANIINEGDYQIRAINGNHGFIGHEDYDYNVNLFEAKALGKTEGDTIKDIYANRKHIKPAGDADG